MRKKYNTESADNEEMDMQGNPENNEDLKSEDESLQTEEANKQEKPIVDEWQEKYDALNDKYLRLYSEFENYRKRTIREKSDLILNGGKGIILDLLPILDDFERAITNNAELEDADAIRDGFQLIYNKLGNSLKNKGLQPMDCKGKSFDAEEHEAVANFPAPKSKDKGKVIDVAEKGYYLNDKVLRHAKVIVGQ